MSSRPSRTSPGRPARWPSITTSVKLYGAISAEAAKKGLELYAEHADDARAHPGKHPNIDRLLALMADGGQLRVKHVFAASIE